MNLITNKGNVSHCLKDVAFFILKNKNNISIKITNYGLRVMSLNVPDRYGSLDDVVLGFDKFEDYFTEEGQYFGCVIGQYANRIENGKFSLNGKMFQLDKNEKNNHLHGGVNGYHNVIWEVSNSSNNEVKFCHTFKESETGYPGNTQVEVSYQLTEDNEFIITYEATSDKDTVISLTNHSFFNLRGEGKGTIEDHCLKINANYYLSVNEDSIPDGIQLVENSPFDLRSTVKIKEPLHSKDPQITSANGFDHCFVLKETLNDNLKYAAKVEDKVSGRIMKVYTTEPSVQLYTSNFLDGTLLGKSKQPYNKHAALCLETQQFPNAPNEKKFPSPVLKANEKYSSTTIYQFLVNNQLKHLK